jgi:hypothetical protein
MKTFVSKYWKTLLSLLFGMAAFLFWDLVYPCALSFQEQYQLFLFDSGYFVQRMLVPGGLADYLAEFLTQFYYVIWLGAIILALLYVLLQRMVWILAKRRGAADAWYLLSFVPSIILWFFMGDENVMLSFVIASLLALLAAYGYDRMEKSSAFIRYAYLAIAIPVFYWLFGADVFVFIGYVIIQALLNRRFALPAIAFVYTLAVILLTAQLLQYPLYRLFGGINYYRYPAYIPYMQIVTMALMAVMPFVIAWMPSAWTNKKYKLALQSAVIVIGGFFLVKSGFNTLKYELIDYDYLVRTEQWNKIISRAEHAQASTPLGVSCVNLALAQTGQLGDRLFDFYQNGAEGLFPSFQREMMSPLSTSEIFYRLGMVNDAQRYTFEAQEAIPNYLKSGRCTKRLAETNLINGDYAVAAKYLRTLQKSLFYRAWADKTMALLHNEAAINADPVYGTLRKLRQRKHDYLFSDREMDQMLGMLFVGNYGNRMAFEYLMAYELLQRDLQHFQQYYPLGKYADFDHIPRSYQEALVYMWTQTHPSFDGMPWSISQEVCQNVTMFAQTYMHNPNDPSLKEGTLGKTFWSYLLVDKDKTASPQSSPKGEGGKPIY